jgi:hypothetical protein
MQRANKPVNRDPMSSFWPAGLLLLLAATGCGGDKGVTDPVPDEGGDANPPAVAPGSFALSHASGFGAAPPAVSLVGRDEMEHVVAPHVVSMVGPSFDLGAIKATDEFFFILSNAGGTSITGITIASNNPSFEVSPTQISELPPNTGAGTVTPVVRVTAVHGIATSGLGFAELLPPGTNNAVIDFNGTTTDSVGASIPVAMDVSLTVTAQVFDIQITDQSGVVGLPCDCGTSFGIPEAGGGGVPVVGVLGDIVVENTGNVDIVVLPFANVFGGTTLTPGTSFTIPAGDFIADGFNLIMDGGGTVSDQSRLPILTNGLVILSLDGRGLGR